MENLKGSLESVDRLAEEENINSEVEGSEQMIARLITKLREIAVAYAGKRVLVVSHGGCLRLLLIHLGIFTEKTLKPLTLENSAVLKLKSDGVDFYVEGIRGLIGIETPKSVPHFKL